MIHCSKATELSILYQYSVFLTVIELFELEGTFKDHLVQLPCNEKGHLQLHQVLRALTSLTLNV